MVQRHRKFFSYTVLAGMIFNLLSPLFLLPWQQVWACFGAWDCDGNSYCAGAGSYPDHPGSCASYGERGNNDRTTSEIAQDYINNGGNPAEVVTRTQDFQGALSNNDAAAAAARAQELAVAEAQRIAAEQAAAANAAAAAAAAKAADDKAKAEAQRVAQEAAERSGRAAANAAAAATAMTPLSGAAPAGTPAAGATVPAAAAPAAAEAACGSSSHNACSPDSDGNWYRCNNGSWQSAPDCKPAGAINCVSGCAGANGCMPEGTPATYNGVEKVCRGGRWDEPIPQKPNLAEAIDATLGDFAGGAALKISPSPTARPIAAAPTTAVAPSTSAPIPTAPAQQTTQEQNLERFRCEERGGTWTNDNTCQSPGRPSPTIVPSPTAAIRRPVNPTLIPAPPTPVPTVKQPDYPDESRFTGLKIPTPLPTNRPAGQAVLPEGYRCSEHGGELIGGECRTGVETKTERVWAGGGTFGRTVKVTTKTFCSGNTAVTQTSRSDGTESSDSKVCEWGCDGGSCRPPTIQETAVVRMDVINNAIDQAKVRCERSGKTNCDTAAVYADAMENMDPEEPSPQQVAIRNSGTTSAQRETLIQAEYNKLLREQVELASMGEAGAGMIAGPIDQAGLRQLAEKKVDETIAAYKLSEGGGNTPAAVGRSLDKIGELSAEEAQGQIDQQGWLYGTIIAKPMFCGMNNNYRASGACGIEHVSVLNEEALESARAYWTFLITGRTEQALQDLGMIIGDPRSPGFQGRDYNANVALPCGVRPSQQEMTDEELACLKGKNVESQFRLAEVDEQNQTNAVLNVAAAVAGFAGGAIAGGARATSLIGKTGLFLTREGIVSDVFISPLFAENTTAGQRAGADVLAALATAPDLTQTERETLSELAAQADEEADRAYTENLLMNAASTVVIGAAGSGAGRAAREVFGETWLGRLLLGNLPPAARQSAAQEVADALNSEVIAPASLFPNPVSRRVVSAEDVLAGVGKAKTGLTGDAAEALASPGVVAGANVPVGEEVGGAVTAARTASRQNSGFIAEVKQGVGQVVSEGEIAITDVGRTLEKGVDVFVNNAAATARSATQAAGEAFDAAKVRIAGQGAPADVAIPESGTFVITSIRDSATAIQPLPIENVPRRIIDPNTLTDQIDPKLSSSADVYKLKLEIDGTETPVVVKVYRFSDARTPMAFPNEINRAQIADQLGIGPRFHGIADLGDGRLAYIVDEVPGVTSKGAIAGQDFGEYVTRQTLEDVRTIEARLADNGFAVSGDFEFMITPDGRAVVIDPSAIIPEPSSSRLTQTGGIMDDKIRILMKARAESQGLPGLVANAIDSWSGALNGPVIIDTEDIIEIPKPGGVGIATRIQSEIADTFGAVNSALAEDGIVGRAIAGVEQPITNFGRRMEAAVGGGMRNLADNTGKAAGETIASISGDINARFSKGSSLDEFVGPTGVIHNSEFLADVRPDPGLENAVRARPETGYTNQLKAYLEESPVKFGLDADGNRIPLGAEDAAKLREASLRRLRPDEVPAIVVTPEGDGSKLRLKDLFECNPLSLRFQFIPRVFATGRGPCQISAYPNSTIRRPNGVVEEFSTTEDIGGGGFGRVARTGPGEFSKIAHDAERAQYLIAEKRWLENADRLGFGDILPKVTGDIYDESGQFIGFTMTEIENAVTLSQWPFLIPERVLRPFLDRLAELDNLGLFHRDIFPKNVMVVLEPAPVEKGFRVRNLVLIDPIEPISGNISHLFLDSRFPLAKSYSETGFYETRTSAVGSLQVIVPKNNVDAGEALINQHNFTVAHKEYSQVRNPLSEEELKGIANHEVSSKYGLIPADELPTTDGQSITRDDYVGIKNKSGTGLERTTDDAADAIGIPCNPITFRTGIPQVYAGSRDPCPITLFGPNGPAAKASKAVKDFFGGEELPVRTISVDENIAETIQPFFKTPLSDSPQSTVGRIDNGTTFAATIGSQDNPRGLLLESKTTGLVTIKPRVGEELSAGEVTAIVRDLKKSHSEGFAVTRETQLKYGDILKKEGFVGDGQGRLTWIPAENRPGFLSTPRGYKAVKAADEAGHYIIVNNKGENGTELWFDSNSGRILRIENVSSDAELAQAVSLVTKDVQGSVEVYPGLLKDRPAVADMLLNNGFVETSRGRLLFNPQLTKPPTGVRLVAAGLGVMAGLVAGKDYYLPSNKPVETKDFEASRIGSDKMPEVKPEELPVGETVSVPGTHQETICNSQTGILEVNRFGWEETGELCFINDPSINQYFADSEAYLDAEQEARSLMVPAVTIEPESTVESTNNGDNAVIGNGELLLGENFSPGNLAMIANYDGIVVRSLDVSLQSSTIPYLQSFFNEAARRGYTLVVAYGYRSYETQAELHAINPIGAAPAGRSQHQTGIAFDIFWIENGDWNNVRGVPRELMDLAPQYGIVHPLPWDTPHFVVLDAVYPGATQDMIGKGIDPSQSNAYVNDLLESVYGSGQTGTKKEGEQASTH